VLFLPEEKWKGEGAVRGFRGRKDASRDVRRGFRGPLVPTALAG
jgi:hypothetical protein